MRIGMGCKAQTAAIAMARICNAADLSRPRPHARAGIVNTFLQSIFTVVAVAQLVESQIVILVVVGSSPISHPSNPRHVPLRTTG